MAFKKNNTLSDLILKKFFYLFFFICLLLLIGTVTIIRYESQRSRPFGNQESVRFFAQYLEDYILAFVFKDQPSGYYVDVGAAHPDLDTVTKYFYIRGWKGINIEPIKFKYDLLIQKRPRDKNYNIGISDEENELDFYENQTTFSKDLTNNSNKDAPYKVKVRTLSSVLEENEVTQIDFLKIDVEGFEKNVLLGLNLNKYRPKVILLEALSPGDLLPSHEPWEYILTQAGYEFILFDGLNRFYLAKEHKELVNGFKEAYNHIMEINKNDKMLIKEPYIAK